MHIKTHLSIDQSLCGQPQQVTTGRSQVQLSPTPAMAVDDHGLIHGGFIFGLADYAAMIAVNHPNVVLGASTAKFLKPVRIGDSLTATAQVEPSEGRRRQVAVEVCRGEDIVFSGEFTCFILEQHVLDPA